MMQLEGKRKRRQCERRWRRTGLTIHREVYLSQRDLVNQLIYQANIDLYSDKIRLCGKDQQLLFNAVDELLHWKKKTELPDCDSDIDLADKWSEYFVDKISKIRKNLDLNSPKSPEITSKHVEKDTSVSMISFTPTTIRKTLTIILLVGSGANMAAKRALGCSAACHH